MYDVCYEVLLALKLLDSATLYSKNKVREEYENNYGYENLESLLYEKAIYPNGERLGFYNTSKFNLNDFLEKDLSEVEFEDYLNGFSAEIKELISISHLDYSWLKKEEYIEKLLEIDENIAETKNNILSYFLEKTTIDTYIDFDNYSNFLINTLFDGISFEENISILHIAPRNYLIFECLNFIKEKNPNCNVNLSVISRTLRTQFPLKFLAIINRINLKYIFEDLRKKEDEIIYKFFEKNTNFDFIIYENVGDSILDNYLALNQNIESSSRIIYLMNFRENVIYKEWLENDALESLILIPVHKLMTRTNMLRYYNLDTMIVLNYNKPSERKNKCILIDNNKNKQLTTNDFTVKNYKSFLQNEKIYENSYKLFSNFEDRKNSKVMSLEELIRESKNYEGDSIINLNDLLYENKMDSQKNYFKIDIVNKDFITTEQLNYDVEELGDLVEREYMKTISPLEVMKNIVLNGSDESIDEELSEFSNYLYFSTEHPFTDKWAFYDSEIFNHELYIKVKLISDKISLEYLYYYLNSEIGVKEYEYFHRGIVEDSFFEKIRVAIPPKEIQDKIVESMSKRDEFLNDVQLLKNITNKNFFDYERNMEVVEKFYGKREYFEQTQEISMPDNWLYTYRGLIWPLAISYLIATSGGFEKTEKANNLLRLFEFTTAFNAYVLISGIPEEVYERRKHKIWNYAYDKSDNDEKFKEKLKLTFGSWFTFHYKLKDIYNRNFNTEIHKEFYYELLNEKIIDLYKKTLNARNEEFHDGIVNAHEAESFLKELNSPKLEIFNYLNSCYKNIKLYYNFNSSNARKDGKIIIEHNVMFLNGPYSMPIYTTIEGDELLEPETLYLHDEENNKFAKLDERLIKFEAKDEHKHDWRLYVFIGFETDDDGNRKAIYRNYLRSKDIKEEHIDLNELM